MTHNTEFVDHRKAPFVWISVEMLDTLEDDAAALAVYMRIVKRAGHGNGAFWESIPNMATAMKMSDKTIRKCLAKLVDLGAVEKECVPGKTTRYVVTDQLAHPTPYPWKNDQGSNNQGLNDQGTPGKMTRAPLANRPDELDPLTRSIELNNSSSSLNSYARDQDHDDSNLNQKPQAPSQEPTYHSPVNPGISDRDRINHDRKDQDQEATPQFRRPPRYPSLAPNPACSTSSTTGHTTNGTPWLPMAPWTSREEYDRFRVFLEARFPGKNRGYIDAICDRVGKGDFENSAWADFRAGNAPENKAGTLHVPQEWLDLVEAEINPAEEAHRGRVHALIMAYNSFRRKYTYSSTGKESKLGTAADEWAKAQVQQLQDS